MGHKEDSGTVIAQEAVPYPQSRILFSSATFCSALGRYAYSEVPNSTFSADVLGDTHQ